MKKKLKGLNLSNIFSIFHLEMKSMSNGSSQITLNPAAFMNNMKEVSNIRAYMTIILGCIIGIMGVSGYIGFVYYIITNILLSIIIIQFKFHSKLGNYIPMTFVSFIISGISDTFLSFVLFWTLLYGLVHLY